MLCQICKQTAATVHITELLPQAEADDSPELEQRHICETCARSLDVPQGQFLPKTMLEMWKALQKSARRVRKDAGLTCQDCGMTLAEFRQKGRLGCPKDYELFGNALLPLLERIHNGTEHLGRLPGLDTEELRRRQELTTLRARLEEAIREEEYENAAQLRDEIQQLESSVRAT